MFAELELVPSSALTVTGRNIKNIKPDNENLCSALVLVVLS